ncbi:MAG: DUF1552 domain-containing protein [Myxococcota bacterium]
MSVWRRRFLQTAGLSAVAWPFLRSRTLRADGEGPRRLIVIFTPNGPQHEVGPTVEGGSERDFELHDWWRPLDRHKTDGLFFRGVHQAGVPFGENGEYGHRSGTLGALTARTDERSGTSTGESFDQFVGQRLQRAGVVTPKRQLLWGHYERARGPFFEAAGQPVAPIASPYAALADIAPSLGMGEGSPALNAGLERKHFVLDHIAGDCARLRSELDGAGREMLEFHCSNIESLETSVAESMRPRAAECRAPTGPLTDMPMDTNWTGRESRDDAFRAFTELAALSLVCDITRVLSFSFGSGASRFSIPESYGVPTSGRVDSGDSGPQMHAWTHQGGDEARRALRIFYHWFGEHVASLIDKLKSTTDADGRPLLESTLVLWTSEFGAGGPHSNANVPVMLFGNACGAYETGRQFVAEGNRDAKALVLHQLFVSLARHMGLSDVDQFGNAGSGPLDWLAG